MQVSKVNNSQTFTGHVVVLGKISKSQNYLFGLHKNELNAMLKDKPYDLFVKQSKSKNTIMISSDKKFRTHYMVRKNKQNFAEVAEYEIARKDRELEKLRIANAEIGYAYFNNKLNNFSSPFFAM